MASETISIAMCTYNAERFIAEQLDSFLMQTVLPTELVIQDDCSTDGTLAKVAEFARRAPFPVRVESNAQRLGPTGNFERSMGRSTGDVVVFSDADDAWYPDRLEVGAAALRERGVGCAFSDADLGNEDGSLQGRTLWESVDFGAAHRRAFSAGDYTDALFRRTIGFGGTMTVRGEVLKAVLPIPRPWGHDNWTAVVATALFGATLLPRSLMMYRQHGTQYSGANQRGLLWRLRAARTAEPRQEKDWVPRGSSYDALTERLASCRGMATDPARLRRFQLDAARKARHQQMRERLPGSAPARVVPVLADLLRLRYRRYSNGTLSALRDLVVGKF